MSQSPEPLLLLMREGPTAVLQLNRPNQLNALSVALRAEIVRAVRALSTDQSVRAIVLTGSGRAFSAGVDLKEAGQSGFALGRDEASAELPDIDMASAFAACPWPVIAAVNGFAITGGFELALMADVILASTEARFADTHGRVGLMPVWGLSQKLPRLIGPGRAKELSLTGNFLDAASAERWGLVNRVLPPDELMPAAMKLAQEMSQIEGALLRKLKALINDGLSLPLDEALKLEIARGSTHNASVTAEAAEQSRQAVMERGRRQQGD